MSDSSSTSENNPRRISFLDKGGRNSIINFASSYTRAQSFVGSTLGDSALADEISPCTLQPQDGLSIDAHNRAEYLIDLEINAADNMLPVSRGYDHINNFHFPPDENLPLIPATRKSSRSSFGSGLAGYQNNSTAPQTIFNAVNTLMGIAMLSLSFGFRLAGWVLGTFLLIVSAWTTAKTAKILGSVMKKHQQVATYGDIAYLYGGKRFQALATSIFLVDIVSAAVLLVLLFSDSFTLLFPQVSATSFKIFVVGFTFVLSFLPLSIISLASLTGILCTFAILVLVTVCGFLSSESPGSLLSPAPTYLWPKSFSHLLLSFGVFMAPWGGHPVFPELYRDMRHPRKYAHCCNVTFLTTFNFDYLFAVVGFLMYGGECKDTLTKNIMVNENYPSWVNPLLCTFLGVLPLSKLALIIRPIVSVYENHFHMNDQVVITYKNGRRVVPMTFQKFAARVAFAIFHLVMSLVFTSFGKIIAFIGSAICFTICVTFPLMFHLKLNSEDLTPVLRAITIVGICLGFGGAIAGTYASVAISAL